MSQAANPLPTSGWTVTAQIPRVAQNAQGQAVPGVEISFVTGSQQPGSVWVPNADYNVATVRALIAARVAVIDGIQGLTD